MSTSRRALQQQLLHYKPAVKRTVDLMIDVLAPVVEEEISRRAVLPALERLAECVAQLVVDAACEEERASEPPPSLVFAARSAADAALPSLLDSAAAASLDSARVRSSAALEALLRPSEPVEVRAACADAVRESAAKDAYLRVAGSARSALLKRADTALASAWRQRRRAAK